MRSYASAARAAVLVLTSYSSAASLAVEAGVPWRTNLDAAKIEAAETGKPLLLHFWTPTCGPCRVLEQTVFNQPQVAEGLQQNFIPVKINADTSIALASSLQIRSVPTDVVITAQGNVVTSMSCPNKPEPYLNQLVNVAEHYRRTSAGAMAGNSAPSINVAYAGLDTGQYGAVAQPAVVAPSSGPQQPVVAHAQANPYIASRSPTALEGAATSAPRIPGVGAAEARYAATASPTQTAAPEASAPSAAGAAQVAITSQAPARQQAAPTPAVTELPPGAAPLAFDGYCPVSLKFDNKWVAGDVAIGMEHRGRTYLFSSEQHRQQFVADPDGYCPVFDGQDPVVMLEERRAVEGSRRFGFKYEGVFYLFSSAASMEKFKTNPASYAHGVQMAMRQLDGTSSGTMRR